MLFNSLYPMIDEVYAVFSISIMILVTYNDVL